jgi:hypothetical protein
MKNKREIWEIAKSENHDKAEKGSNLQFNTFKFYIINFYCVFSETMKIFLSIFFIYNYKRTVCIFI